MEHGIQPDGQMPSDKTIGGREDDIEDIYIYIEDIHVGLQWENDLMFVDMLYIRIYTYVYTHTNIINIYIYIYICINIHINCAYIYICIYIYICTYTHIGAQNLFMFDV